MIQTDNKLPCCRGVLQRNIIVSEAAIAIIDGDSYQGEKCELLASWCDPKNPVMWHSNYAVSWSDAGCI
jgi:hypothetical protein